MTRARWLVGALIGAAALVVAGEALASYIEGRLVVGIVAVTVLIGVLGLGFASLGRARRAITRELAALGAQPPGGALYLARRQQALDLRRRGVTPDLDALADATAAEEAERGYTGKYLVATTVLIGLVGTFGGLMETLARVSPLLKGELAVGPGALALIAGPLAGLHITFGTSVVAIMVTLALALVQGDVTLHHERLLALLQERTRHVLVPELWPAEESTAERTVRALLELRASVAETLAASGEANAAKIAAVVRVEVQRLVEQVGVELREANRAQGATLERATAAMTESARQTAGAAAEELRAAASTSRDALTAAAASVAEELRATAATSRDALTAAAASAAATAQDSGARAREDVERVARAVEAAAAANGEALRAELGALADVERTRLTETVAATMEHARVTQAGNAELMARAVTALDGAATALAAVSARTSEAFTASTAEAVGALAELRGSIGKSFGDATQALSAAATELDGTMRALSPALAELTPQLGALAAEVALLAARADDAEQPNAVLDELVRLGEDVERLVTASLPPPSPAQDPGS